MQVHFFSMFTGVLANCNEIILLFCCPGWLWRIFSTSRRAPSSLADLP